MHTARWVVPVARPPIRYGALLVEQGIIKAVGTKEELAGSSKARVVDHGQRVLFPGLVNAHTHLEFSALKGKCEKSESFCQWLKKVAWKRLLLSQKRVQSATEAAVGELEKAGTALAADVANLTDTGGYMAEQDVSGIIFHEVIGLKENKAEEVFGRRIAQLASLKSSNQLVHSLSPHAPYSVSAELFHKVKVYCRERDLVTSVHLAESPEEIEFCLKGTGPLKRLLSLAGLWDKKWKVPGVSPVEYLAELGFLDEKTLAVHLTQATARDVKILAKGNVPVCLCVRSNVFTGVGQPPVKLLLEAGVNLCLGTDSLASNMDLDLVNEMRAIKRYHPFLSETTILEMATINGARALGFAASLGSLEPGKRAYVLAVPVGESEDDPQQAIFNARARVTWIIP